MTNSQTKRLKKILIDREVTVTDLAEQLGVTKSCVSRIINGKRNNPTTQAAIADALGEPHERLFGRRKVA